MIEDSASWADWWFDTWCPILGPVPTVEGMTEVDFAGKAAGLIHGLRRDFFDVAMMTTDSVESANAPRNPDDYDHDPNWIEQARVIHREAMSIEKHTLWALKNWRLTRAGQAEPLRLVGALNECRGGHQRASVATFEQLLMTSVDGAFEYVLTFADVSGKPAPFKRAKWPIHNVLAVLAIHAAADTLHDMLADYHDQPIDRRLRGLLNAQELDRIAREYKAAADARAEPSRRGSKARGVPRPNAQGPLRRALQVLVDGGMSNAEILRALSDADGISGNKDLPIETNEPDSSVQEDGVLKWYPRGGDSENPVVTTVKRLRNLLSEVRKSRNPG